MDRKQIVFLKSAPALPVNGSIVSMCERLSLLQRRFDWDVSVYCLAPPSHREGLEKILHNLNTDQTTDKGTTRFTCRSVPVTAHYILQHDAFSITDRDAAATAFNPVLELNSNAIFFGNVRDFPVLSFLVNREDVPSVFFLTEDEYIRPENLKNVAAGASLAKEMRSIRNLFVASRYIKESFARSWGIEARLLVNAIDIDAYQVTKDKEASSITLLHPYSHKGVDIFLGLVKALPQRSFLLAGGTGEEYRKRKEEFLCYPNLRHLTFQPDVRLLYAQSRLILVPSLWNEVFPRVVVEALASGTPVIASNRGGISEAGGEAAIYLPLSQSAREGSPEKEDIALWVEAIRRLDDHNEYAERVLRAGQHTERYRSALQSGLTEFDQFLRTL